MTARRVLVAAAAVLASASASGAADRSPAVLLPLTRAQIIAAGAAGTGCAWLSPGRAVLFAAADDRAVVRLQSGIVPLTPDRGAADLFPFTFDRWTGGGLLVELRPDGRAVQRGGESMERRAVMSIKVRGAAMKRRGRLNCGS